MAISSLWQSISSPFGVGQVRVESTLPETSRATHGALMWVIADVVTVLISATLALVYEHRIGAVEVDFLRGTLIPGRSLGTLLALLSGFTLALLITSRRMHLYMPRRLASLFHEQAACARACITSGLLLAGTLYLIHAEDVPRKLLLITVGLVTVTLSLRRLIYRAWMYRRFRRGIGTRNVLIVGTGPEAQALRQQLEGNQHLGYTFKGFLEYHADPASLEQNTGDVVGTIDSLFQHARRNFVDEIFLIDPGDRNIVKSVLEEARTHRVDLRVVPAMYDEFAWNSPVEYVGAFPTVSLHCGHVPEIGLLVKRLLDVLLSVAILLLLSPLLVVLAIAVKLDSPGSAFYLSERIGKRGRVFHCIKFRTMVQNAHQLREKIMHMNEREGVLFKVTNDPRITTLGRFLRKYSLDELPQFFNVLRGDMSIVGPRPPIASEVREYELNHLRRLDVMPGITGLWQVIGRQNPSFESYISLDVAYIESWSVLLDITIIFRTIGVVLTGTGS